MDVALEVDADFFLDDAVVGLFFRAGVFEGGGDDVAGLFDEVVVSADEAS